ncbi:MAG: glycosyltransferase involved in cell wall biosynthesis [Chlamydiales bacterium]|jgi:glycosyltransferase involved in cell wall biosynthesis
MPATTPVPGIPHKPRVAILGTRGIPARYGGFETFAEDLSVRLVEAGFDVTVICPGEGAPAPTRHRGVTLEYVKSWGQGSAETLRYDCACLWRARKRFDVVYMLGYASSPLCFLPRIWGTDVWINMDGIEWRRSKWTGFARLWLRFTEALACRVASRLIFDNQAVADDVMQRNGGTVTNSVIAYGALLSETEPEQDFLKQHDLERDEYYLAVCRFEPENQVREIVAAFIESGCSRPLIIVTNAVDTRYSRETLALCNERVRFIGSVYDRANLFSLRTHCRAYVHGHTVGGTNPSLLESMACGNLVISHDNPFNREVLDSCGLYFQGSAQLARALRDVDQMELDARVRKGAQARERVREFYTWEKITRSYVELLGGSGEPELATIEERETRVG